MSLQSDSTAPQTGPQAATRTDQDTPALRIDVTAYRCPMTFVRTCLALDRLASGQILAVRLGGEEAARSVPQACAGHGHTVLSQVMDQDGVTLLLLRRK